MIGRRSAAGGSAAGNPAEAYGYSEAAFSTAAHDPNSLMPAA